MKRSRRSVRNFLACAAGALCLATSVIHMVLFFSCFPPHPARPSPQTGLIYPLNNHGSYVYLTSVEATGLALLIAAFVFGFLSCIAVVPKDALLPRRGTLRWVTYAGGTARTDLAAPTRSMKAAFCGAGVVYSIVILLFGNAIAKFAVSHGIVLSAW